MPHVLLTHDHQYSINPLATRWRGGKFTAAQGRMGEWPCGAID